jgi:hypothetical protein
MPTNNEIIRAGLDQSMLTSLEIIDNKLIAVWQNFTRDYYKDRHPDNIDYFGVIYDLPAFQNPREFTPPGKVVGVYGNKLMILENDDPLEFTIGFYVFDE